jgi:hypothetical protein
MYTVAVAADDGSVVESGVEELSLPAAFVGAWRLMAEKVTSHSASIHKKAATLTTITPELEHIYFYFR